MWDDKEKQAVKSSETWAVATDRRAFDGDEFTYGKNVNAQPLAGNTGALANGY
jgi:hypothetical protein